MNITKLSSRFLAAALAVMALTVQSCGSDEPESGKNPPSAGGEDVSTFVGGWSGAIGTFIFFNDGNAKLASTSSNVASFGKWTFGNETNILATTINNWQFFVTLSDSDSWAALSPSGSNSYSFERINKFDYVYTLMRGAAYVADDGEKGTCGGFDSAILDSEYKQALWFPGLNGYIIFNADGDNKDNTFKYALYTREYHISNSGNNYYYFLLQHQGIAEFSNMDSSTKCTLKTTSDHKNSSDVIKHTFTLNNTGR